MNLDVNIQKVRSYEMALLFTVLGDMLTCHNTDECEETLLNQFGITKIPESNRSDLIYMSQQD